MSKKPKRAKKSHKRGYRRPLMNDAMLNIRLPELVDGDYTAIPVSLLDAGLSDYAFVMAMKLCMYAQDGYGNVDTACQYPNAALLATLTQMPPDLLRSGEKELLSAGILTIHENGTYSIRGLEIEQ